MERKKLWPELLAPDVYERLCNCTSVKEDILPLTQACWSGKLKDRKGFKVEDALVCVLELLDSNGRFFDLTKDEFNDIIHSIIK